MISILIEAGPEGMRLCNISRRIFNIHTSFFNQDLDYAALRDNLKRYLWQACHYRRSIFRHISRGVYGLKPHVAVQLDFDFADETITPEDRVQKSLTDEPIQLYLFD
ncbi:MAG: hypothetical protein K6F94_01315 [Bacteroidaceae bacterium]|nr:hypothetical protein [Bacteroidaceae bacterium]